MNHGLKHVCKVLHRSVDCLENDIQLLSLVFSGIGNHLNTTIIGVGDIGGYFSRLDYYKLESTSVLLLYLKHKFLYLEYGEGCMI